MKTMPATMGSARIAGQLAAPGGAVALPGKPVIHLRTSEGVTLCGIADAEDVKSTRLWRFVDCPSCKAKLEDVLDAECLRN